MIGKEAVTFFGQQFADFELASVIVENRFRDNIHDSGLKRVD
jgi:hypothetical protein